MENNNVKIIAIIAVIIVIVGAVIFGVINILNKDEDKSYKLETIAEQDYKYFILYTGGKYGVINTKRRNDNR